MMSDMNRIGARIDRTLVEAALGYLPEVGEAFEINGLALRVMARTVGVEPTEQGQDDWFDELFVASVESVDDLESAGQRLRSAFLVGSEVDGDDAKAGPDDDVDDSRALEDDLRRAIEDLLKAA